MGRKFTLNSLKSKILVPTGGLFVLLVVFIVLYVFVSEARFVNLFEYELTRVVATQQRTVILIGLAGLVAVTVIMGLYITKLLKPLTLLTKNLRHISSGEVDFNKKLPVIGNDEIAQVSAHFNSAMEESKKLIASIEDHAKELGKKETLANQRMRSMIDFSPIVCALFDANGDAVDVNKEVENMFGIPDKQMYIEDFNNFLPKFQPCGSDSISKNKEVIDMAVREGRSRYEWTYLHHDGSPFIVEEIAHSIDLDGEAYIIIYIRDLTEHYREKERERIVQRKMQAMMEHFNEYVTAQSASVSTSSAAVEEMIANIRSVTNSLSGNAKNVKGLQESSVAGQSSLSDVVTAIQGIARESESLMEINSVMENIASQTNLLSMNAAIEAAHAGDAGRGFAVVAGEIRKLAESSGTQSKTIGNALKSIKNSIDKITMSTDVVLGRFDTIERGVKTVAEQEDNVFQAMEEQDKGSKQILQAVGNVNDITHKVRESARLMVETSKNAMHKTDKTETDAFTDNITGVRNREYFVETTERELRYCVDEGRDFNLVALVVDNMEQITNAHGYEIRDAVLKVFTMRVSHSLKQGTLLARYSDDMFVFTLPNVRSETAAKLAEQVQKNVKSNPFSVKGVNLNISVSLGVASMTNAGRTLVDIISNAEKALAAAQAKGTSKVAYTAA
ncbi:MAG: diguanylate cyclase [Treponema sp.]|jgi:diguanylate cyclase (GGDEF)-like protein/PAS domain S-box-containing protein|nr:diguanylate cyclase [Treponema sp.]